MKQFIFTRFGFLTWLVLLLAPAANAGPFDGWQPLLSPAQLHHLLQAHPGAITLVDIRAAQADDPDASYAAGHIPAAVSSPYVAWRGEGRNPGVLVPQADLTRVVQALGVDARTPVVVIHRGRSHRDFAGAARVYWTLKSVGLKHLAILDGGFLAWKEADLPVSREVRTPAPSDYPALIRPDWYASTAEVRRRLREGDIQFLDARSTDHFEGRKWKATAARPGTIAGAEHFDNQLWFEEGSRLASRETLEALIRKYHLGRTDTTISFCNTGHLASTSWFVLSELFGVPNVKLYPESLVEWSAEALPMDNVPGRLEWAWLSTRQWLSQRFN